MKLTWDWFLRISQLAGIAFLLISLPLSNYFMSLSTFFIAGAWVLDVGTMIYRKENIADRFLPFFRNRAAIVLTSLYALVLIGMIYSDDLKYGMWDLKMKLPFLFMPLLISGLRPVTPAMFRSYLLIYISTLVFAVTICFLVYFGFIDKAWNDVREISIFISHIRFSLLLVFGIAMILFVFSLEKKSRILYLFILAYFVLFLWIIESITGFTVLFFIVMWYTIYQSKHSKYKTFRWLLPTLFLVSLIGVSAYLRHCYSDYFTEKDNSNTYENFTPRGASYFQDTTNFQLENGHYIMRNISWTELTGEWLNRSELSFEGLDSLGNPVKGTLIRYLTSRGLKKDKDGMDQLSDAEIKKIEQGSTNYLGMRKGIRGRIDKILFEYDAYLNGDNPSGHSVMQRLEFWKAACGIIRDHFLIGVGTGDVKQAFESEYVKINSSLDETHRLRAHNQYLTFFVSTGIIGLIWFLVALFYPVCSGGRWKEPVYVSLIIIVGLSCITEDTLETQAGVTFFIFFSSVLLFLRQKTEVSQAPRQD